MRTWPPKGVDAGLDYAPDAQKSTARLARLALLKFCRLYHPDRNAAYGEVWKAVSCEVRAVPAKKGGKTRIVENVASVADLQVADESTTSPKGSLSLRSIVLVSFSTSTLMTRDSRPIDDVL